MPTNTISHYSNECTAVVEALIRQFPGRLGLSIDEFSSAFDFSRNHTKNLIQGRKVRVRRYGRRVIIPMDEVIAFMLGTNTTPP